MRSAGSVARSVRGGVRRDVAPVGERVDPGARRPSPRVRRARAARGRWSRCEWTPPVETRPSRCTAPPRSRARRNAPTSASFVEERPVLDRPRHADEVLVEDPARADRQVPDLRVAHLPVGQPDRGTGGVELRVRVARDEVVEHRRVPRARRRCPARRGDPPAVEDDERDERDGSHRGAADRRERRRVERGAADERAVDGGLRHQLGGVLRLDRAAVEDAACRGGT